MGDGGPSPILNPSAGEWPPLPGRYRIVRPTSTPASSSGRIGHHRGSACEAQALGQVGEDPSLQLADQREKEVRRRRDGHADDRGEHQQRHVAADRSSASGSDGVVIGVLPDLAAETERFGHHMSGYFKMFTALATTSSATSSEIASSVIIMSFAHGLIAETSVGLNAVAVVNDRCR